MLREGQRPRLLLRIGGGRPLSRQRVPQGDRHRRRLPRDSDADAEHRSAGTAAHRAQALRLPPGHDPGHRLDRHRQDHHAGVDDRLPEFDPHAQHHQPRGSDRVRPPQQVQPGHPARARHPPAVVRRGRARGDARGSGRDPGRRNARCRDHLHGDDRRRDRAPGARHAAHHQRRPRPSTASSMRCPPRSASRPRAFSPRACSPSSPRSW